MGVPRLSLWLPLLSVLASQYSEALDVSWYPPKSTEINDLDGLLNRTGVYGFIFDSSKTPDQDYGTYNWCNMPHVRKMEYKIPSREYTLQYIEVVCSCPKPLLKTNETEVADIFEQSDPQTSQEDSVSLMPPHSIK